MRYLIMTSNGAIISGRGQSNKKIVDGRRVTSSSGIVYELRLTKTIEREKGPVSAFDVVQLSKDKTIGTVTSFTSEARLFSLLDRKEKPNAMEPVEFISRISGNRSFLYIPVTKPICDWANIRIDDCFDIEIVKKNGEIVKDLLYHLSLMKTTPIINITRLRRMEKEPDHDGQPVYVSCTEYGSMTEEDKIRELAIIPGELVKVKLSPAPGWQDFFFADNL